MKILYIHKDLVQGINAGGINTVYLRHIEELSKLGHEIHVITSRESEWNLDVAKHIVSKDKEIRNNEIKNIIDTVKPDIVDCFSWGAELLDYVTNHHNTKVIMRADIPMKFYGREPIDEQMAIKCDHVISISNWCDFEWSAVLGKKTTVIPHACDKIENIDLTKTPSTVTWVGKATEMKGFDLLFNLPDDFFKLFKLTCVCARTNYSDPKAFEILESKGVVIKENLTDNDYNALLASSEFILSTARREGFCIAVLEAMRYGAIPVVPYWIGGTTDFVNKNNGIVYDSFDDCLQKMIKIKNKDKISKNAIETAKSYNWPKIAKQSLDFYERVLNES